MPGGFPMKNALTLCVLALSILVPALSGAAPETVAIKGSEIAAPLDRTSPMNTLSNFALAWTRRDIDLYTAQLAPDFAVGGAEGTGQDGKSPMRFDRESTVKVNRHLFADATSISYDIDCEPPVPSADARFPADQGYWQVNVPSGLSVIHMGDPDKSVKASGRMTFVLKDFGTADAPDWKLVYEEDY